MRVKRGKVKRKRRRRLLKQAKGFRGKRHSSYRIAKERVMKALQNAYTGRKLKKREYRRLWTVRVNAASRARGLPYSRLIHGLREAGVALNRKMLAELAVQDGQAFDKVVELAKSHLPHPNTRSESDADSSGNGTSGAR